MFKDKDLAMLAVRVIEKSISSCADGTAEVEYLGKSAYDIGIDLLPDGPKLEGPNGAKVEIPTHDVQLIYRRAGDIYQRESLSKILSLFDASVTDELSVYKRFPVSGGSAAHWFETVGLERGQVAYQHDAGLMGKLGWEIADIDEARAAYKDAIKLQMGEDPI